MYADRLEVTNPGGLYGRLTLSNLGKIQPDTRNPVLATALEVLKVTKNRYSGIPTIRKEMAEHTQSEPVFINERGEFKVTYIAPLRSLQGIRRMPKKLCCNFV